MPARRGPAPDRGVRRSRGQRFVPVSGMRHPLALSVSLLVFACGSAWPEIVSSTLAVSAQVLPHVRLESGDVLSPSITVTASDVTRGYVDVVRSYRLRTNARDQVVLHIEPQSSFAPSIDVGGFATPLHLAGAGLDVTPPALNEFELTFRVWLAPRQATGEYPLPWRITAAVF